MKEEQVKGFEYLLKTEWNSVLFVCVIGMIQAVFDGVGQEVSLLPQVNVY